MEDSIGDSLQGVYSRSITESRKFRNGKRALAQASSILHGSENSGVIPNSVAILPGSTKVVRGNRRAVAERISSTKLLATNSKFTVRTDNAKAFSSVADNVLSIFNIIQLNNDCAALLEDPVEDIGNLVLLKLAQLFFALQREN